MAKKTSHHQTWHHFTMGAEWVPQQAVQ